MKRKTIDYLVNSHPHPDHLQGLLFLLENFEVGRFGIMAIEKGVPFDPSISGIGGGSAKSQGAGVQGEEVNGVKVNFLHPPLDGNRRPNFWAMTVLWSSSSASTKSVSYSAGRGVFR